MKNREQVLCLSCEKRITIYENFSEMIEHQQTCFISELKEGYDYVICKLCGYAGKKLTQHIKNKHGVLKEDYVGELVCEKSKNTYSVQNAKNGDWISEKIASGADLKEYFKEMGKSISKAIMDNPKERERRSELRGKINRSDFMRQKASEAAKKTSSRRDVQLKRASVLKKWREENPEKFRKIFLKMTSYTTSKQEIALRIFLQEKFPNVFLNNQRPYSEKHFSMNKSKRKQVDFMSRDHQTIIEFDGVLHFKNVKKWNQLEDVQNRDAALENYCIENNKKLVRISWDQWNINKKSFDPEVLEKIENSISGPIGIYKIGNLYNKPLEVEASK